LEEEGRAGGLVAADETHGAVGERVDALGVVVEIEGFPFRVFGEGDVAMAVAGVAVAFILAEIFRKEAVAGISGL
jgi:hypothetical protein